MRSVIIEDERLTAQRLARLVGAYAELELVATLMSVQEAKDWFAAHEDPELIFLDIQLSDGTAFDLLEATSTQAHIIFTTAYDEYAIRAFKYNSIDYLLKPVEEEELRAAIHKLRQHYDSHAPDMTGLMEDLHRRINPGWRKRFLVKAGEGYQKISVEELAYFYNHEGMTLARHQQGRSIPIDLTLERLQEELDPAVYFRINRQLLVSAESIQKIEPYHNGRLALRLLPEHPEEVIVSRERVTAFKHWLNS